MQILGNGRLITHTGEFFEDGAVVVDGTKIVDFGNTSDMKSKYSSGEFVDCGRKVIMPGFINCHQHIYSQFARGLNMNNPPAKDFLDILKNVWWRLDKKLTLEDTKYSAYCTFIEGIRAGVTTVFDHHASPFHIEGSLAEIGKVATELGVRASLCYEVSDRDGEDIFKAGVKENMDWIKYANSDSQNMLRGMFGLHASFTLSEKSLNECAKAMQGANTGYHVHVAEGIGDVHDSLKQYGKRIVHRLFDHGMLSPDTLTVHCIHVNEAEMDLIKETGAKVVHNPQSNMGNAVGCSPIIRMVEKGLQVGIGTDGYTADMTESMKVESIIHKHNLCNSNVGFMETGTLAFESNPAYASHFFGAPIGKIEKGAEADIIVVDYEPPTPMLNTNCLGHILFGMSGRAVDSTMVAGKFIMKDRKILTCDEKEVFAKAREVATDLWKRV